MPRLGAYVRLSFKFCNKFFSNYRDNVREFCYVSICGCHGRLTFSNEYQQFLTRLSYTFYLNNFRYQLVGLVKTANKISSENLLQFKLN